MERHPSAGRKAGEEFAYFRQPFSQNVWIVGVADPDGAFDAQRTSRQEHHAGLVQELHAEISRWYVLFVGE